MALDPKVFKAYDVRGLYPEELDEEGAQRIGRAYVEHFEPRRSPSGATRALSSPTMAKAVIEGVRDAGADVVDIGLVGTEMLYFAVGELELDGGIMVTASHNPKEYTGLKIVRRGALPVGGDSGLLDVRDRADFGTAPTVRAAGEQPRRRTSTRPSPTACSRSSSPRRSGRSGSCSTLRTGWPGRCCRRSSTGCPIDAVRCFFEPDGNFPNHEPNPLLPENREFIVHKVLDEGADLGIAFDGDADRCFFVDDAGEFVPGDFVTALLARGDAREGAGRDRHLRRARELGGADVVEGAGGTALVNRVGHAYIKHRMRETGAAFAGEVSGHYYFRDFTQADSGIIPALLMLELVSKKNRPLSEILRPYRERYFLTGELNTPVTDVDVKLRELEERFGRQGRCPTWTGSRSPQRTGT